jgi:hypothetical protein
MVYLCTYCIASSSQYHCCYKVATSYKTLTVHANCVHTHCVYTVHACMLGTAGAPGGRGGGRGGAGRSQGGEDRINRSYRGNEDAFTSESRSTAGYMSPEDRKAAGGGGAPSRYVTLSTLTRAVTKAVTKQLHCDCARQVV